MSDKKVLIVGEGVNKNYYRPFSQFGEDAYESELLWEKPWSIELVVFTGGADVSPSLYGQEAAAGTLTAPKRDIFEHIVFTKARSLGLKMAGICRGAQFLNVMAGGTLIQHLDGHGFYHSMTTINDRNFEVSSTHHQMIVPPEDSVLVGWSTKRRSNIYLGEGNKHLPIPEKETEVVFWPKIKAVGMQYHPEMMSEHSEGFRYAAELVEKYLK